MFTYIACFADSGSLHGATIGDKHLTHRAPMHR